MLKYLHTMVRVSNLDESEEAVRAVRRHVPFFQRPTNERSSVLFFQSNVLGQMTEAELAQLFSALPAGVDSLDLTSDISFV